MTHHQDKPLRKLVVPPDRRFTLEEISAELHLLERFDDVRDSVLRREVLDSLDLLSEQLLGRRDTEAQHVAERISRLRTQCAGPGPIG